MVNAPPILIPDADSAPSVFFTLELTVGFIINVFFLVVLLYGDKEWTPGKKLLLFVHGNEFVLIVTQLFPWITAVARNDILTFDECIIPSAAFHLCTMLEPMSIALMCYLRYELVRRASLGDNRAVPINRWIAGVTLLVMALISIDLILAYTANLPAFLGPFFICVQKGDIFVFGILVLFFTTAPFVIFYTWKLIKLVEGHAETLGGRYAKKAREAISIVKALTMSLYICHTPWFIGFIKNMHTSSPNPPPAIQGLLIVYLADACFSPLISILLNERYREASRRMLSGFSVLSRSGENSATHSGKKLTDGTSSMASSPTNASRKEFSKFAAPGSPRGSVSGPEPASPRGSTGVQV